MSEYSIQPYGSGSYPLMKELFEAAFGTQLDKAAFAKKYDTKTLGHEVIGFIAVHNATQTPAAFYGVFPVKIVLDGKEILTAQSGDTMTHPLHQKKGLFVKLAQMTYAVCKAEDIGLVFGQPNQNSRHGLVNRLHFAPLDNIVRYDLKLQVKTIPLPKILRKARRFDSYLTYAKKVLKRHTVSPTTFTNTLQTAYGKVLRNEAYLAYKNEPDKVFIRIRNTVFWLKLTDVLWIGDVDDYTAVTLAVLKKLKRLAFLLGYNTVRFHLNESLARPAFLQTFTSQTAEASCFLYLDQRFEGRNLVLTGADFDTW